MVAASSLNADITPITYLSEGACPAISGPISVLEHARSAIAEWAYLDL